MNNNKGMSIIEIIISIALVSIILVFMINLLITVKNSNDTSSNRSDLLINKALITKEIEKDFKDYELNGIGKCELNSITSGVRAIIPAAKENVYCLKFTFAKTSDIGYLIQYKNDASTSIVGYKRGTNQIVRESSIIMNPNNNKGYVSSSCSSTSYTNCGLNIKMPIVDAEGNDFSIRLTYIYASNLFTYSSSTTSDGFIFS